MQVTKYLRKLLLTCQHGAVKTCLVSQPSEHKVTGELSLAAVLLQHHYP